MKKLKYRKVQWLGQAHPNTERGEVCGGRPRAGRPELISGTPGSVAQGALALSPPHWPRCTAYWSSGHPLFPLGINSADSLLPNTKMCYFFTCDLCLPCSVLVPLISLKRAGVSLSLWNILLFGSTFMASWELLEIYPAQGTKVRFVLRMALSFALSDVTFSLCRLWMC